MHLSFRRIVAGLWEFYLIVSSGCYFSGKPYIGLAPSHPAYVPSYDDVPLRRISTLPWVGSPCPDSVMSSMVGTSSAKDKSEEIY